VVPVEEQEPVVLDNLVLGDQDLVILPPLNKEILAEQILLKMGMVQVAAVAVLAVHIVPLCLQVLQVLEEVVQHPVLPVKALLEIFLLY
jgi:hypothetical protein